MPPPSPPSQRSPNADKPRFLWISWVSSSIQALGFIVKVAAAFLRPLLWFSVDPSFGFFFFALREFDCRGVGVAWWVRWVWAWLIFFSLLWAVVVVVVVVVVCVVVIVVYCKRYIILL